MSTESSSSTIVDDRAASGATSRTVSVMFVLVVSSQFASTMRAARRRGALVGQPVVVLAGQHPMPIAEQLAGAAGIGLDDHVRNVLGRQPLDQPLRDRVVLRDDHVPRMPAGTSLGARSRTRASSHGA